MPYNGLIMNQTNTVSDLFVVKFVDNKGVSYLDHSGRFKTPDLRRKERSSIRWAAKFATKLEAEQAGADFVKFLGTLGLTGPAKAKACGPFTVLTVGEAQ